MGMLYNPHKIRKHKRKCLAESAKVSGEQRMRQKRCVPVEAKKEIAHQAFLMKEAEQ